MQRLKRAEDKKKQEAKAQTSSSSSSWHWHSQLVGVWLWALTSKMVWPLMTQANLYFGGSILICGKSLNVQKNLEFLLWKSVTADSSLLSPTGGCKGNIPCTSYSRTFTIHKYGYGIAYTFTHNMNMLEHIAINDNEHHKAHARREQCAVLSTPRTARWCTVSHIALVAQGLAVCVIPMSSMHAHLCVVLWASLLTRLSTSSSCSPSSSTWCPTRRLTSSPSKIPCATPAWGAWSLWTMSHPSLPEGPCPPPISGCQGGASPCATSQVRMCMCQQGRPYIYILVSWLLQDGRVIHIGGRHTHIRDIEWLGVHHTISALEEKGDTHLHINTRCLRSPGVVSTL